MTIVMWLATFVSLWLAIGTMAWQTPVIGLSGSLGGYLPGWLLGFGVVGVLAGGLIQRDGFRFAVSVGMTLCVLAIGCAIKVMVDQRAVLASWGIPVQLSDFCGPLKLSKRGPDDVVTYGPVDEVAPRMAVYRPNSTSQAAPVVVHIHGGGWQAGNEVSDKKFCRYLADHGYLVFSPTYTLSSNEKATWDLAPREVATAIATADRLSADLGGAQGRVFLTGFSAGGNLAPLVANRVAAGELLGTDGLPEIAALAIGIPATDPGLAVGLPFARTGKLGREIVARYTGGSAEEVPERYEAVNATNFLTRQSPPTLLVYGVNDWLVPSQATHSFAQRARSLGVEVRTAGVPWVGHLIGLSGVGMRAICELTVKWLDDHGPARDDLPNTPTSPL